VNRSPVHRPMNRSEYAHLTRHSLMVCATLVQNPANLGALCRTCEAFRLEALVIADESIAQTAAFRNLAASTHHWQPLISCPRSHLLDWLTHQRQQGYCPIALHADATAIPLSQFAFPQRSILVLGQELTGISSEVVQHCDQTVTIPQFGLVESLNVQTAGSIAVYEYMRQWASPSPQSQPEPR
jgi:tRNA G18 (ribose-2'-O)-methylase SpoU